MGTGGQPSFMPTHCLGFLGRQRWPELRVLLISWALAWTHHSLVLTFRISGRTWEQYPVALSTALSRPWALPGILGLVGSLGRPSYVLQCYTSAFITGVLGVVLDYFCSLTCATSTTTNLLPLHPSYLISLIVLHFGAELHAYMDA